MSTLAKDVYEQTSIQYHRVRDLAALHKPSLLLTIVREQMKQAILIARGGPDRLTSSDWPAETKARDCRLAASTEADATDACHGQWGLHATAERLQTASPPCLLSTEHSSICTCLRG